MLSCRASLEDRLRLEEHSGTSNMADSAVGSKQLTFKLQKVNCSCPDQFEMRLLIIGRKYKFHTCLSFSNRQVV